MAGHNLGAVLEKTGQQPRRSSNTAAFCGTIQTRCRRKTI